MPGSDDKIPDAGKDPLKMKIRALLIPPLSLALSVAFLATARADFYRYVDGNGVVHITNTPTSGRYEWMMSERGDTPPARVSYRRGEIERMIHEKAILHGVDPALVKAIVKAESDFDPAAVSPAGARGLMQLMPRTARLMGVRDIDDPEQNVEGGIRYLTRLLRKFDWSVPLAVAAYNAGETAVARHGSIPPFEETRDFVKRVLSYQGLYRGHAGRPGLRASTP